MRAFDFTWLFYNYSNVVVKYVPTYIKKLQILIHCSDDFTDHWPILISLKISWIRDLP